MRPPMRPMYAKQGCGTKILVAFPIMAASLTNFWLKFFQDAGILNMTSTAIYATIFTENEIQKDMIVDLTREILRELGITTMGHVLAILKHAKAVHNQSLNEKIVASTSPVVESREFTSPVKSPVKSSPISRMIEYYVKPSEYKPVQEDKPAEVNMRLGSRVAPKLADRLGEVVPNSSGMILKVTDRLGILKPSIAAQRNYNMISLKPTQLVEEVPVKRIRQVLPEEEGGYKITMPRGTTPRTKQILAKQSGVSKTSKAKTVFQRLGEGSVSSTTCVDEQQVTFTGLGSPTKAGGVFRRLGEKAEITSTITSENQAAHESVGYFGVLKKTVEAIPSGGQSRLNNRGKNRLGNPSNMELDGPEEKRVKKSGFSIAQKVVFKPSAVSRLGPELTETSTSRTQPRVVKKKFIKTLANGKRVIVTRDVVEEVQTAPKCAKKAVTFGESKFRSDNITTKAGITSRLGEDEQEWDY